MLTNLFYKSFGRFFSFVGLILCFFTLPSTASAAWIVETIDSVGDTGRCSSIALDTNNKVHISYCDITNHDAKYITNTSGSWISLTLESAWVDYNTSLSVDSNDKVHISYYNSGPLRYASNLSGSWVYAYNLGPFGYYNSITTDSNSKVHISSWDSSNGDLKYTTNISDAWVTYTIDSVGSVGSYSSIALDSNNKAHISYYSLTSGDLKYVTNASGSWVISTIDSTGNVGQYTSIALDSNNKAHISYYNVTNADLKYATNASGSWVISTIDSTGNVGQYTSIALDSNDNAHISYYDVTNGDLKYATNASGSWVISAIDSTGNVGQFTTSITLDSNDNAHISYYDVTNGDLKYAHSYTPVDADGDGYTSDVDCNDNDLTVYPGASEICDVKDNNCNGQTDEGLPLNIYYRDADGDSYGNPAQSVNNCSETSPAGYVTDNSDCDDNDPLEHPDQTWYLDADSDGYSEGTENMSSCTRPLGYKAATELAGLTGDCDDNNAALNPATLWYTDSDGDGYGNPAASLQQCIYPGGAYVLINTDCNDLDPLINPASSEIAFNNQDDDCNPGTPDDWAIETVDAPEYITNFIQRAIAIDKLSNQPHIAFGGDHLSHAYFDGTQWQFETIDDSNGVGQYTSIAIDSNNKLHISYYDAINKDLKYATNASGSWVKSTIDSTGSVGEYSSIAVDSINKVHISYYDAEDKDLKYATNASGSWIISALDSTGYVGEYTSIAVDSNNNAHISYYDASNADLKYASNSLGVWALSTIDTTGGKYTSIAVDTNGKAHISYFISTTLKYATNTSGSWVLSTIGSAGWEGYTSIALDNTGKAHISYFYYGLKYATNLSGSWIITEIESTAFSGRYSSIAVDTNGKAHISYYSPAALGYATNTSGVWIRSNIYSAGGNVGLNTSIAVDTNGKAHISYFDATKTDLKYATNANGGWYVNLVDPGPASSPEEVAGSTSIAVDSSNNAHIAYRFDLYGDLLYASNISGVWASYMLGAHDAGLYLYFTYPSIALDSLDNVYISYIATSRYDRGFYCMSNASGAWTGGCNYSGTFPSAYNITDIALDSLNDVHLSNFPIALDSSGMEHMTYRDGTSIMYKTNASGMWVSFIIDSAGVLSGENNSIAVDSNDNVHISYYDAVNGDLKYATNASGTWVVKIVDSIGDVGQYSSLAIDASDNVHISYYDAANRDLKYATNRNPDSDDDGDGYTENEGDCRDNDPEINPGAVEICDNVDNNCNGQTDEGLTLNTYYSDADGDNYGDPAKSINSCSGTSPAGYVMDNSDCNDSDPLEHLNQTWYLDADSDGYSDGTTNTSSCTRPAGYKASSELTDISGDCDDGNAALNPTTLWYPDIDTDGYGNSAVSLQQCEQPVGYVLSGSDCDDYDADIYPGGPPVRIADVTPIYFATLQGAYDAALDGETVEGQAVLFSETLILNLSKSVILNGGYDCGYSGITGKTTINGTLTINNGTVRIENFLVQ